MTNPQLPKYKAIADAIVSPTSDITVLVDGAMYQSSIHEQNRYATIADVENMGSGNPSLIRTSDWTYPTNHAVTIQAAIHNQAIALKSNQSAAIRWHIRDDGASVVSDSLELLSINGQGTDGSIVTFNITEREVAPVTGYHYNVEINTGDTQFGGTYLAVDSTTTTITLSYDGSTDLYNRADLTGSIYFPSVYNQVEATEDGVWIKNANWSEDPTYSNYWLFQTNGSIKFPNNPSNARTGTGEVFQFGNSNQQSIITGPSTDGTAQRLVIAGQDGASGTSGEGGDIYLWAGRGGDSNGNGGDIKVDGGNAYGYAEGGTVKVRGGYSPDGLGGFVQITAGGSDNSTGGAINISAGSNYNDTESYGGSVNISAGGSGTSNYGGSINLNTSQNGNINLNSAGYFSVYVNNGAYINEDSIITASSEQTVFNKVYDAPVLKGRVSITDGNGTETAHIEHSYTGTTRIIAGDDIAIRSTDGDIILYPGNDDGGPGRAYIHWGDDNSGSNPQNEIATVGYVDTNKSTYATINASDNGTITGTIDAVGKLFYANLVEATSYFVVPTNASVAFPIGSEIKFATSDTGSWQISAADTETTTLVGEGSNGYTAVNYNFIVPPNSTATLLKVETDRWILSSLRLTD